MLRPCERAAGFVLTVVFLGAITLPIVGRLAGVGTSDAIIEKRSPSPLPKLVWSVAGIRTFAAEFDAHWKTQFGFRYPLVHAYNRLLVRGLRTSSSPQVMLGRYGWLFYTGDDSLRDLTTPVALSEAELRRVAQRLSERQAYVESLGGHYLMVIVPSKHAVYTDHLPSWARQAPRPGRLDQVLTYVREHTRVDVLDLRPALRAASADRQTYYRTDTHWNDFGAFIAYGAMMDRLRAWCPALQPLTESDIEWVEAEPYWGDLAQLITIKDGMTEERTVLSLRHPPKLTVEEILPSRASMVGRGAYRRVTSEAVSAPSLFVFHDSYMNFLVPYVPARFSTTWFKWQPNFDAAGLGRLRPDLVVHEVAERFLESAVRENPPEISEEDHALRKAFDAAPRAVLALTNSAALAAIRAGSQVALTPAPDGLHILATGPDPIVYLPSLSLPRGGTTVVRLSITSLVHTDCQIFYHAAGGDTYYSEGRYLVEGRNELLIPLRSGRPAGPLRLDPGETSGEYIVHAVEVRVVSELPDE